MLISTRVCRQLVLAWLCAVGATAAHAAPPVADFFKPALLGEAKLSPSGKFIAATRYSDDVKRHVLVVIDLADRKLAKVVAAYP